MQPHSRYEMLEKIGSGSYATVYRGRDLELGREVAIKQIHEQYLENPEQLERYWQEAQMLASFQHPNIVTIYDIVRDRGWLILELMQGNLSKVSGRKPMDLNGLRATLAHCLRALKFLHEHGIVHGDIKPGNMMIDRRRRVKIGDFGLARRVSDDDGSLIKGTTKYMAPEVVSDEFGSVGPASDLYSLGFAAYELMCGANFESLFPGLSAFGRDKQIAWMMWHAAPDRRLPEIKRVLEGVPEDLARTIQKLTAKPQSERYRSADEALSDLNIDIKLIKTGEDAEDHEANRTTADAKKRRMILIGGFATSVILSLLMLFLPSGNKGSTDPGEQVHATAGVVREVTLGQHKIEVEDEDGIPSEITVGEKPRIRLNDEKYILLRDLKKGDRVEIKNDKDAEGRQIVSISALRPEQSQGRIKSLNSQDGELILSIEDGAHHEDVPLHTTGATKTLLNGKAVPLGQLNLDDRITVLHLKDTAGKASRAVLRLDAFRTVKLTGFVQSIEIDKDKQRLNVEQRGQRDTQVTSLEFSPQCKVKINGQTETNGRTFGPQDLKKGDRVVLLHDTLISEADVSRRDQATGVILEIDEAAGSIAVQSNDRKMLQFKVDAATEINLNRDAANLSDLRKYDAAEISFDPQEEGAAVARTVDVTRPVKQDRLALFIVVQNYADRNLTHLDHTLSDARLIQEMLVKRYSYAPERILFLADPDKNVLEKSVADWLKKASNLTQVLVYFGGHAYADEKGTVYLAPKDLDWKNISGSGLKLDWLVQQIENTAGKEKILLLDASHAGNGSDLAKEPSTAEMIESLAAPNSSVSLKSVSVIASCRKGETGLEWSEKQHGLFAWMVAEAFSGRADKNRDLFITASELFDDMQANIPKTGEKSLPVQSPQLYMPKGN